MHSLQASIASTQTCTCTGTCFIQKIYAPSPSLLQGKHLPFSPSPLRVNMFRLFVILSLTQLYRYTPEIFLFSTATFKYTYRAPLRRIGQEYSANVAWSTFKSLKRIQPLQCLGTYLSLYVYFCYLSSTIFLHISLSMLLCVSFAMSCFAILNKSYGTKHTFY
jgi:hypothetical protein